MPGAAEECSIQRVGLEPESWALGPFCTGKNPHSEILLGKLGMFRG